MFLLVSYRSAGFRLRKLAYLFEYRSLARLLICLLSRVCLRGWRIDVAANLSDCRRFRRDSDGSSLLYVSLETFVRLTSSSNRICMLLSVCKGA